MSEAQEESPQTKQVMSNADSRIRAIAPAPGDGTTGLGGPDVEEQSSLLPMSHRCENCVKRKIKCDKTAPRCFSCRRSKLQCSYETPLPRSRKRKLSEDDQEKLKRYEQILRQHGLLDAASSSPVGQELSEESVSLQWNGPGGPGTGKLLVGSGTTGYIESRFWRNFEDSELQGSLEHEEGDHQSASDYLPGSSMLDPLTGALMGVQQSLQQYHPTHTEAKFLWQTHVDRVEPLCKILHVPSTTRIVEAALQNPEQLTRADECLLFAIYHFAVFSMTDGECMEHLRKSRSTLMQLYHFAARQALINASFLRTTQLSVLQALLLFLVPCRRLYDSQTYWILTGVAVRIAQRIGLHQDGESLGLPPFDVQIRRRLFYQLLPLDGNASVMSGTGLSILPHAWTTKEPLNVNDNDIWPGMSNGPQEQRGATELIFCLSRACIGKYFAAAGNLGQAINPGKFKDYHDAERVIIEAEKEVEERFIRYCDVVDPLHFLTICSARSGITAMRLRARLPKFRSGTGSGEEKRQMFDLAQKILEADRATCAHKSLAKYRWHMRPFFLWGTWDSLVVVLTSLCRSPDIVSSTDIRLAWNRVERLYENHDELLELKRPLYIALGRLTLKAWDTRPLGDTDIEPAFIVTLRSRESPKQHLQVSATLLPDLPAVHDVGNDTDLDQMDWALWDQLMQYPPEEDDWQN